MKPCLGSVGEEHGRMTPTSFSTVTFHLGSSFLTQTPSLDKVIRVVFPLMYCSVLVYA